MAEEQAIETLRIDLKLNKNFDIDDLKKISSRINSLSSSIKKLYDAPSLGATRNLLFFIQNLSKSIDGIEFDKISNLGKSFKSLASISNLAKLEKINWNKISSGFKQLSIDIDPFLQKVKSAEASLVALNGVLSRSSRKKIDGTIDSSMKPAIDLSTLNFAAMLSSLRQVYFWAKRVGSVVQNIAQGGMDYNETLNLWTVAMRGHNEEATKFLNKMNEAYGVSEQTLMNAQATFKNMIGSLGQISSESAYILSEGITQMALDYASLYNVSIESAMTKFQAALAGQVRPIRTGTGLDITENTLFQFYKELGGEKTVRQLNRTEKQLLSILAVYKQMEASGAIGDMKNTIEYAANQSRVMAETWADIKDYVGLIIVDFLEANDILIKINAGLMVVADVLKAFAEGMGAIKEQTTDNSWGDALGDIAGDAGEANEEVKKLKSTLFGFDKFQVLGDTSGGLEDALDLDNKIIEEFERYKGISEGLKMEARALADKWLDILSFTKDANGQLQITKESLKETLTVLSPIFNLVLKLSDAIVFAASDLLPVIKNIFTSIGGQIYDIILIVLPLITELMPIISSIVQKIGHIVYNILEYAKPIIALVVDALTILKPILVVVDGILFAIEAIYTGLLDIGQFMGGWLIYVLEFVMKIIQSISELLTSLFRWNWNALGNNLSSIWSSWDTENFVNFDFQTSTEAKTGRIYTDSSQLEASIARGTMVGMSTMSSDASAPIDIDVSIDGQNLFQIFRGVAQRNGYDVVKVR